MINEIMTLQSVRKTERSKRERLTRGKERKKEKEKYIIHKQKVIFLFD